MRENRLLKTLKTSHAINAWLSIPSSYSAEIVSHCKADAVTVDLQHGMTEFSDAVTMLQAISTTSATPLVRPGSCDMAQIMHLLDAGAYGVICPQVDNPDIARDVVAACKYPPAGKRSFGPSRGLLYGGADYFEYANSEILVIVMIESKEAVENLDGILATPGVDGIYIGPNDLSLAYGFEPHSDPQGEVGRIIEDIRVKTHARNLITGIFCSDGVMARRRLDQGFQIVTPGSDAAILRSSYALQVDAARGTESMTGGVGY